jgi:hypothetical protein
MARRIGNFAEPRHSSYSRRWLQDFFRREIGLKNSARRFLSQRNTDLL